MRPGRTPLQQAQRNVARREARPPNDRRWCRGRRHGGTGVHGGCVRGRTPLQRIGQSFQRILGGVANVRVWIGDKLLEERDGPWIAKVSECVDGLRADLLGLVGVDAFEERDNRVRLIKED